MEGGRDGEGGEERGGEEGNYTFGVSATQRTPVLGGSCVIVVECESPGLLTGTAAAQNKRETPRRGAEKQALPNTKCTTHTVL